MYDYSDINSFLQSQTGKDEGGNFIFTMYFDMTIFQVVIVMNKDYEPDFSEGEFASVLGYDIDILQERKAFVGGKVPGNCKSIWVPRGKSLVLGLTSASRTRSTRPTSFSFHIIRCGEKRTTALSDSLMLPAPTKKKAEPLTSKIAGEVAAGGR